MNRLTRNVLGFVLGLALGVALVSPLAGASPVGPDGETPVQHRLYIVYAIQLVVDGLNDKLILITEEGLPFTVEQQEYLSRPDILRFVRRLEELGSYHREEIYTPCEVRK